MHSTAFYGVKGGQGTSLVACSLALTYSEAGTPTLLRSHDVNETLAMLGHPDMLEGETSTKVSDNLFVSTLDDFVVSARREPKLREIYDLGINPAELAHEKGVLHQGRPDVLPGDHTVSAFLVARPDYLVLRKALKSPIEPKGIVLVREDGRSLQQADVEDVLGIKVVATIPVKPAIATAVDAGLLARRLPNALGRGIASIIDAGTLV